MQIKNNNSGMCERETIKNKKINKIKDTRNKIRNVSFLDINLALIHLQLKLHLTL